MLDIDPRCAQDHGYFSEMDAELASGGREALLADLLAFDLRTVNLREIPRTAALLEQKLRSLDPIESWWVDRLMAGAPTREHEGWAELVPRAALFDDHLKAAERTGVRRRPDETSFGMKLRKLVPGLTESRPRLDVDGMGTLKRVRCYGLPSLADCRAAFEEQVNQTVAWPADEAPEEPEPPG